MDRLSFCALLTIFMLSGCGVLGTVEQRVDNCANKGPGYEAVVTSTTFNISDCWCGAKDTFLPVCPTNRSLGPDCCAKGSQIKMGRDPHTGAQLACGTETVSYVACMAPEEVKAWKAAEFVRGKFLGCLLEERCSLDDRGHGQ